ncbi:MAG: cell wall-active antibiotics response protein [Prolixibacteraceae bacterium]|nr:cell wall-active antibiotics response protein [Prolixibacteraceae bacterium]
MEKKDHKEKQEHHLGNRRLILGIVLIFIGVGWMFNRLGILPPFLQNLFISWQMLLIIIGTILLVGKRQTSGWILVLIGAVFLIPDVWDISEKFRRLFFPLLLVLSGVTLLVNQGSRRKEKLLNKGGRNIDYFDDFVIFGNREVVINSQNFMGGESMAVFGGSDYDLRTAQLAPQGAIIECMTIFGGTSFKIPPDCTVKNEVSTLFGSFNDKRGKGMLETGDLSNILIIRGMVLFGGIEIKNIYSREGK